MKGVEIEYFTLCIALRKVIFFIYQKIYLSDRVPLKINLLKLSGWPGLWIKGGESFLIYQQARKPRVQATFFYVVDSVLSHFVTFNFVGTSVESE